MARQAIESLRDKNLEPTLDHISIIIELARRIEEPSYRTFPWLSHVGVQIGDSSRRLRPLTIKSGCWYDHASEKLLKPFNIQFGLALAMEYGHDKEYDFSVLYTEESANKAVGDYLRKMEFTVEELQDAMSRVMDPDYYADQLRAEKGEPAKQFSREDLIGQLVAYGGQSRESFESSTLEFAQSVMLHALQRSAVGSEISLGIEDSAYQRDNFIFQAELIRIEQDLKESSE